jgi:putative ABC transport system permease protein
MLLQDLRYAIRSFAKAPGFAAVAIVTLALGIGATTAIFSVVHAVLLRPLEYPEADRLIKIVGRHRTERTIGNISPGTFVDIAREATSFERIGANGFVGLATIADERGEAERAGWVQITEGFFPTLGVEPVLGRAIQPEDDQPGAERVVLISDGFWRRRFGGDPSIVGQTITFNAMPVTVIGVLPASYRHLELNPERPADLFTPSRFAPVQPNRGGRNIRAVARLKEGVTLPQARAELEAIALRLSQQYSNSINDDVHVEGLLDSMVGGSRPVVILLAAAVVIVLLVACANVANLLLARGTGRLRELALRAAIGADRGRLMRQMLTESAALSLLGAAGGLGVAWAATRVLTVLAAAGLPRAEQIAIDAWVLGFAVLAALLTGIVFGIVPAWQLSRLDLNDTLKEGGRQQAAATGRGAREGLIVAEVALSIVLLVGAGLLIRSLHQLQRVSPGFSAEQAVSMEVSLPTALYPEGDQMPFYQQLEERVRAIPGVLGVGAVNILPLSNNYDSRGIQVEDDPKPDGQAPGPQARSATPGYFAAMGIPLIAGRHFDARDTEDRQRVVIVNAAMARAYWPAFAEATAGKGFAGVIGKRITFNNGVPEELQQRVGGAGSRVIVGVVGDVKHLTLDEATVPMFYTPHTQQPSYHTMRMVVRSSVPPATLTPQVREALSRMDREVPLSQVATLSSSLDKSVAEPRMRATLLGLFAGLAMALAAIGVYGVVAYLVGQRTQEIGVRRALGAQARDVVMMLVRESMRPVLAGIGVGLFGAFALSRALAAMLFEVSSTDLATYAIACGGLAVAALLASIIPARRALGIDPISAVRGQ